MSGPTEAGTASSPNKKSGAPAQFLGFRLHELARALPLPTAADVVYWQRKMQSSPLKEGGWRGAVIFVQEASKQAPKRELLCGLAPLKAWHQLGEDLQALPAGFAREVKPEHALWELLNYIGERAEWGDNRRAAAAALFRKQVKAQLPLFQKELGLESKRERTTDVVLSLMANVKSRLVGYAVAEARRGALKEILSGKSRSGLSTLASRSKTQRRKAASAKEPQSQPGAGEAPSRTVVPASAPPTTAVPERGKYELVAVKQLLYKPSDPLADLAIVERERSGLLEELPCRLKQDAAVAYLCDVKDLEDAQALGQVCQTINSLVLRDPSKGPVFELRIRGSMLKGFEYDGHKHYTALWREVAIFGRGTSKLGAGVPDERASPPAALMNQHPNQRVCRHRLYNTLVQAFCREGKSVVFAPVALELGYEVRPDRAADNNSMKDCLEKVCRPLRLRMVVYKSSPA